MCTSIIKTSTEHIGSDPSTTASRIFKEWIVSTPPPPVQSTNVSPIAGMTETLLPLHINHIISYQSSVDAGRTNKYIHDIITLTVQPPKSIIMVITTRNKFDSSEVRETELSRNPTGLIICMSCGLLTLTGPTTTTPYLRSRNYWLFYLQLIVTGSLVPFLLLLLAF